MRGQQQLVLRFALIVDRDLAMRMRVF